MFRFTIRDLLWLTVVVGLTCMLVLAMRQKNSLRDEKNTLRDELERREWQVEELDGATEALQSELEKITGKQYRGMDRWEDPTTKERGYKIIYDEKPNGMPEKP